MYGFFSYSVESYVKRFYGEEYWLAIREKAGEELDGGSFRMWKCYRDDILANLMDVAAEVLGVDKPSLIRKVGDHFFHRCQQLNYDKVFQAMGRTFQEFLCNLDTLHDLLASYYPKMQAPSFHCEKLDEENRSLLLHYYSKRNGLEDIVIGITRSVAENIYHKPIEMETTATFALDGSGLYQYHAIFTITFVSLSPKYLPAIESPIVTSVPLIQNLLSADMFDKLFPFHIAFTCTMAIKQTGAAIRRIIPTLALTGEHQFSDHFEIVRPQIECCDYSTILKHADVAFVVQTIPSVTQHCPSVPGQRKNGFTCHRHTLNLSLKGQMVHVEDCNVILFLCSPRLQSETQLSSNELCLSDIPIHDAAQDLFLRNALHRGEVDTIQSLEVATTELKYAQEELEEEKQKTDELIHSILPERVARQLRNGEKVEAEKHEIVTVLFSDIRGFTDICSHSNPEKVVELLNDLYTMFDWQVSRNNVYKVETIGDAYMVVGGLFGQSSRHAIDVANQALDMVECATRVRHPKTLEKGDIQIRVGIHSGEVMAGVVGMKMPRYCLFGNTVNVASRTESNGQEGKINVSSATHEYLKHNAAFKLTQRGFVEMKGVKNGGMLCYFLESTKGDEEIAGRLVMPPKDSTSADRWLANPSRKHSCRNQASPNPSDKKNVTTDTRQKRVSCQTLEIPGTVNFHLPKPTLGRLGRQSLNPELSYVCPLSVPLKSVGISIPVSQPPPTDKDTRVLRRASVSVRSSTVSHPPPLDASLLKRRSTCVSSDIFRWQGSAKYLHRQSRSMEDTFPHSVGNGGLNGGTSNHPIRRMSDKLPPNPLPPKPPQIMSHLRAKRMSRYSSSSSSLSPLSSNPVDNMVFGFDEESDDLKNY